MSDSPSRAYTGYVVLLLFLANICNYGQRMVVSILLPSIKSELQLTDAQLGLLMGGGFALMYAVAGVPLARWADRHGRVRWLSIALIFWSAATGLFALTRTFGQMLLARVALGLGESMCIPTSHSLLADTVSAESRPFALGIHSTGAVVGITLSLILGGYLEAHIGWRSTLVYASLGGAVLAVIMLFTMREPGHRIAAAAQPSLHAVTAQLLSLRSYLLVLTAICFGMLVEYGTDQWLPSYYVRRFGLPVQDVGLRYGLTVAFGGIPGSFVGGWIAARLNRRDIRWLVWFPAAMYALALPIGLCMLLAREPGTALLLNGVYAFAIFTTNGALWSACFAHVPAAMRATTSAMTLLVAGITGLAVGPALVGGISDLLTTRDSGQSLQTSLIAVECLAVCVIVPLLIAGRFIAREGSPPSPSITPSTQPLQDPA